MKPIEFKELQKKIESSPLLKAVMEDRLKYTKIMMKIGEVPGYPRGFQIKLKEEDKK